MNESEFISHYLNMIEEVMTSSLSSFNIKKPSTISMLTDEEAYIEHKYLVYVNDYKKQPDRSFLMECVHDFGVNRMTRFDSDDRVATKEQFVEFYINRMVESGNLRRGDFAVDDYKFIVEREKNYAAKEFEKRIVTKAIYEKTSIEQSKATQELAYKCLFTRFQHDYESFYKNMIVEIANG
jgi:hypothetical protein